MVADNIPWVLERNTHPPESVKARALFSRVLGYENFTVTSQVFHKSSQDNKIPNRGPRTYLEKKLLIPQALNAKVVDGNTVLELSGHSALLIDGYFLKDGTIITWAHDSQIRLWSSDGLCIKILDGHQKKVEGVYEREDGLLLSWSADCTLRLWSPQSGLVKSLEGHDAHIAYIILLESGDFLSVDISGGIRMWSEKGILKGILDGHKETLVDCYLLTPYRLVTWNTEHSIRIWELYKGKQTILAGHSHFIRYVRKIGANRLVSIDDSGDVRFWTMSGKLFSKIKTLLSSIDHVVELGNGNMVIWSEKEKKCIVLNREGMPLFQWGWPSPLDWRNTSIHSEFCLSFYASSQHRIVIATHYDNTEVWSFHEEKELKLEYQEEAVERDYMEQGEFLQSLLQKKSSQDTELQLTVSSEWASEIFIHLPETILEKVTSLTIQGSSAWTLLSSFLMYRYFKRIILYNIVEDCESMVLYGLHADIIEVNRQMEVKDLNFYNCNVSQIVVEDCPMLKHPLTALTAGSPVFIQSNELFL